MLIVSWTGSNFYFISFPFFLLSRTAHEGDDSSAEMLRRLQVHLAPAGRPHAGAARARVRRGAEVACEAVWRSADEKSTMQLKEQGMLPPLNVASSSVAGDRPARPRGPPARCCAQGSG